MLSKYQMTCDMKSGNKGENCEARSADQGTSLWNEMSDNTTIPILYYLYYQLNFPLFSPKIHLFLFKIIIV